MKIGNITSYILMVRKLRLRKAATNPIDTHPVRTGAGLYILVCLTSKLRLQPSLHVA
jgi:hypothetical protein